MYTIRKRFKFEAAHVLDNAFSKCCVDQIHGHSYLVDVFFQRPDVNGDGMVVDFGRVSKALGEWISSWDHSLIISENKYGAGTMNVLRATNLNIKVVTYNPTAENMAKAFFDQFKKLLATETGYVLASVRIHETTTGWAEYCQ